MVILKEDDKINDYHVDGQLARADYGNGKAEDFGWDGLALIRRGDERFVNEPHVGGGNPVVSSKGTKYFNDILGTTVGAKTKGRKYTAAALTAFGERLDDANYLESGYVDIYVAAPTNLTYELDVELEGGFLATTNTISGLNESAIEAWWGVYRTNTLWSSVGNNCAATVANGLRQGGASVASSWQDWWNSWNVIWSPDDVNKYAKAIIQYQATVTIVLE